ncbi:MAG: hypothetical protein AAB897_02960 [Patescibacteria group bacterium]
MNFSKFKTIFNYYWAKLLAALRVRTPIGGIEISDAVLRIAYFDDKSWKLDGVRLEPGVMESGKVRDYAKFVEALKNLRSKVFGENAQGRTNIVASLSSISIYSQVFSLPIIEGENLEKAIMLNVQMVSPVDVSQAYSGWQMVGRDQDALRLEILSAFIEKSTVDEINRALFEAGFLVVAMESRALALSRIFRQEGEGMDISRSYVMVSIDGSGVDFLIIRRGQLYFEYFNPWRDIMDEQGRVSMDAYRAAILRSLHQVLNFYGQHWQDPVSEVVISATSLGDEAAAIITENFLLPTRRLRLKLGDEIYPDWYIALGCGLRGVVPRSEDRELSLLGIGAGEEFRREQFINFLRLWRLAMPVALGILAIMFFLADLFVIQTKHSFESQSLFALSAEQAKENDTLRADAETFNKSIAMIRSVQTTDFPKSTFIEKLNTIAAKNSISITSLDFPSLDQLSLRGETNSEERVVAFKNALEADTQFKSINLPLTGITSDGGIVAFSMSFGVVSE